MTRTINITCDWCSEAQTFTESELDELALPQAGWIEVGRYDAMSEDVVSQDFCSEECVVSHFG